MDYREAEAYVLSFTDYEKIPGLAYSSVNYDLRRMEKLLGPLGNPHLGTGTIHIAGTKGKGSTAAMTAQALVAAGYRTGLFTSPHLHTLRERIRIDGTPITESHFAHLMTELKPVVEDTNRKADYGLLTTFEILTALALVYFRKKRADFQVLEAGLGGRLDATNVVRAEVCVITSISLDHTAILGNTVAQIAREKAGIIKPGCTVISAPQAEEAAEVIDQVCRQKEARLVQVDRDVTWEKTGGDMQGQSLTVYGRAGKYELTIPLLGDYQMENAACAVAALEALADIGVTIPGRAMTEGFGQVKWPGRLQVLSLEPAVVVDGAHNDYSIRKLAEAVRSHFTYERCLLVFGTSCDKDIPGMAREIVSLADEVIVTSSSHPRAASTSILADEFSKIGARVTMTADVPEALSQALHRAGRKDLILVTGSLFVVAEAVEFSQALETKRTLQRPE